LRTLLPPSSGTV